jgi:hypothetical protein
VDNGHGIYLTGEENFTIRAPQQNFDGLDHGSDHNLIVGNHIEDNTLLLNSGIHIDMGYDNWIHFNNIVGNLGHGVLALPTCLEGPEDGSGPVAGQEVGGGAPVWNHDARQNWWGDRSGPLHVPVGPCNDCAPPGPEGGWNCYETPPCDKNLDGQGDEVSDFVRYCPWLGARVAEAECLRLAGVPAAFPGTKTGGEVTVDLGPNASAAALGVQLNGRVVPLVCTARYEHNPGGPHDFTSTGYYDVWVKGFLDETNGTPVTAQNEIQPAVPVTTTIEFCPADESSTVYYWDGFDWLPCSHQVYNAGDGCVVATVHAGTEPDSGYLIGGPFAVGEPQVGGVTLRPRPLHIALPAAVLAGLIGLAAASGLLQRRHRA